MAIEFTLHCDGCEAIICTSTLSVRDARARAQLEHRAYCGQGDWCRACRADRTKLPPDADALKGAHSAGQQRKPAP
jgi:hypothetical protein